MKPCPFCKRTPNHGRELEGGGWWFVVCDYCGARGPVERTINKAIKSWNNGIKEEKPISHQELLGVLAEVFDKENKNDQKTD